MKHPSAWSAQPPFDVDDMAELSDRTHEEAETHVVDRSIGDFIRTVRHLDNAQVAQILEYQRIHKVLFGEAAIALKLASSNEVMWALSQQFQYPYAAEAEGLKLDSELIVARDPFSDAAEGFRDIRSQLLMGALSPDKPAAALAVLSADTLDGKSYVAANLAVVFSQLSGRTLLLDADMRAPRQHEIFGVPNDTGLSNILAGRADSGVIHRVGALPNLYVLPVGTLPPNPLELLQRQAFAFLVRELLSKFDHVIVDTPAASQGADGRVVAAYCSAALMIGRRGKTRIDAMQDLIGHVTKTSVRFAGILMNDY